jgi:predicted nucleic acid-binding protein
VTTNVVIVDTNVVSYIYDNHRLSQRYVPHLEGKTTAVAAQTVAELRFGAYNKKWGEKRIGLLESLLSTYVIVHTNDAICTAWAKIRTLSHVQGRPMSEADTWIAATALALDAPLVTHNAKDFDFIPDLEVISERM